MNKLAILTATSVVFVAAMVLAGDGGYEPVSSTSPLFSRYEIVQNSRSIRETYLLDKANGNTWVMVATEKRPAWRRLTREKHSLDKPGGESGSYQISVSGKTAQGVYLLNTATGATWTLFNSKEVGEYWGIVGAGK